MAAHKPPELRERCFLGSDAISRRLLTRAQLGGSAWRRLFHNVYADAALADTHLLRCQGAALILPVGAVITGRSAACVRGLALGKTNDPVHVLAPPRTRFEHRGIRLVRTTWLPEGHILPGEPPVTGASRTAWEIASEPDLVEAVVALDVLFHARLPRREVMDGWVAKYPDSRAARAIALADERAESPQETRARVRLVLAGFPAPVPQHKVRMNGSFVARVDLAWPDARVAVEYDGEWHAGAEQLGPDRARLNKLIHAGWTVLHLTKLDLRIPARFAAFCRQLREALSR